MEFQETLDEFNAHLLQELSSDRNNFLCEKILSHSLYPLKSQSNEYIHTVIFKDSHCIRIHKYLTKDNSRVELIECTSIEIEDFKQAYDCLQEQNFLVHNW